MSAGAQCEACGETNAAGSAFCLFCGNYLGWDKEENQPPPSQAAAPPAISRPATPAGPAPGAAAPEAAAPSSTSSPPDPPSPPRRDETAELTAAAPGGGAGCPVCGHQNEPSRRFCAKCGETLSHADPAPARRTTAADHRQWWHGSEGRAARRAYRRSLPPLYRWRRVIIALLVLLLAIGIVSVVEGNPVRWVQDQYHELVGNTTVVEGVTALQRPGGEEVPEAVDRNSATVWRTPWPEGTQDRTCGSPGRFALRLTWEEAVRVVGVRVQPGLRADNNDRLLAPRPATLLVSWTAASGQTRCEALVVDDEPTSQDLDVDTSEPVDQVLVRVAEVHEPQNATVPRPVALRQVDVLRRPE